MTTVFANVRERYLAWYLQCIANARAELDRVAAELLIEPNGSTETEWLFKLIRVDIIGMQGERHVIKEVALDPSELPSSLLGYACPIELFSSAWYGIELYVTAPHIPEGRLLSWTDSWLDPGNRRPQDERGLQGVIHNMQRPQPLEGGYHLAIDFGSAPLVALHDLIELVSGYGATHVQIGSFALLEEASGAGA